MRCVSFVFGSILAVCTVLTACGGSSALEVPGDGGLDGAFLGDGGHGDAGGRCSAGDLQCSGSCVDPKTDPKNCGT